MLNYHALLVVGIFIIFDVITGLIKAWKNRSINSTKMREGLINKLVEIVAVIFAFVCETALPEIGVTVDVEFGAIVCVYIVAMEICSIVENFGAISPELGNALAHVFEKFKQHEGVTNDNTDEQNTGEGSN